MQHIRVQAVGPFGPRRVVLDKHGSDHWDLEFEFLPIYNLTDAMLIEGTVFFSQHLNLKESSLVVPVIGEREFKNDHIVSIRLATHTMQALATFSSLYVHFPVEYLSFPSVDQQVVWDLASRAVDAFEIGLTSSLYLA
jgi:hypothetical protein